MSNAWRVGRGATSRDYGHLPVEFLEEWAINQANVSTAYANGELLGISATKAGEVRKHKMLTRVEEALRTRGDFTEETIAKRMKEVSDHLEDPGLLENFEYFDVPSSDFMLQFYFAVWDRRIAEVMGYLHNYGKDLRGIFRKVPEDDIWFQMSYFEGMNINERIKARSIVQFAHHHYCENVTSFGGGNVPERLYGLMHTIEKLTVFDDGPVSPLDELFDSPSNVNYIHESLANAPKHHELLNTQDLVWMHGVSMYLDEENEHQLTGAILAATALLKSHGYMKYDYLLWTESMRRVIKTQNWPYNPAKPMVIFNSVDDAIASARKTLAAVNKTLGRMFYMDIVGVEPTLIEPWGVTSVRLTLQKFKYA